MILNILLSVVTIELVEFEEQLIHTQDFRKTYKPIERIYRVFFNF